MTKPRKATKDEQRKLNAIKRWVPRHILVTRSEYTAKLLDLEDRRDALMNELFDERLRVFGFEPTGRWHDTPHWKVAIPQALFDQLGHYSREDVRTVCLAWLLFNNCMDDLSEATRKELFDRMEESSRILRYHDHTYIFPPECVQAAQAEHARQQAEEEQRYKRPSPKRTQPTEIAVPADD